MLNKNIKKLLIIIFFVVFNVRAQDEEPEKKQGATAEEPVQEQRQTGTEPARPEKGKDTASPETFTPSEDISEDLSVSFPVDI